VKGQLEETGSASMPPLIPAEFGAFVAAETEKVGQGGEVLRRQAGLTDHVRDVILAGSKKSPAEAGRAG